MSIGKTGIKIFKKIAPKVKNFLSEAEQLKWLATLYNEPEYFLKAKELLKKANSWQAFYNARGKKFETPLEKQIKIFKNKGIALKDLDQFDLEKLAEKSPDRKEIEQGFREMVSYKWKDFGLGWSETQHWITPYIYPMRKLY